MRSASLRLAEVMRTGRVAALADRREDGLAADAREHQVEDDEVDRVGIDRRDRRPPVADDRHRVAVALEVEPQELGQPRLVLDDQDPGARRPCGHPSRAPVKES